MNTNSNVYTVIYTTVVCVMVAAILAFVSQSLKSRQVANEKAETISQILTAAKFGEKSDWEAKGNDAIIAFYKENLESARLIDAKGEVKGELSKDNAEIYTVSDLKKQNYNIKDGSELLLPVYKFNNGITAIPVYGAGLWGPVWGYIAFNGDLKTIAGAYFDHESETPGLGGKIKDDPSFRAQFEGKSVDFTDEFPFSIVKGGTNGKTNAIDAITGATMTSKGVDKAINTWFKAFEAFLNAPCKGCCQCENVEPATEE